MRLPRIEWLDMSMMNETFSNSIKIFKKRQKVTSYLYRTRLRVQLFLLGPTSREQWPINTLTYPTYDSTLNAGHFERLAQE